MPRSTSSTACPDADPSSDRPAAWIERQSRAEAEILGCALVEPVAVLAGHLTEVVRCHADELLGRDATKHLVDELRKTSPAVVDELIPAQMKLVDVQQVLQLLVREGVSIRQLGSILETLGEYAPRTKDPVVLAEFVRQRLGRAISTRYRDRDKRLRVMTLDPALEDEIVAGTQIGERGISVRLPSQVVESVCRQLDREASRLAAAGQRPVVLVSPQIRPAVKHITAGQLPNLVVLSYNEITRDTQIESLATIGPPQSVVQAA